MKTDFDRGDNIINYKCPFCIVCTHFKVNGDMGKWRDNHTIQCALCGYELTFQEHQLSYDELISYQTNILQRKADNYHDWMTQIFPLTRDNYRRYGAFKWILIGILILIMNIFSLLTEIPLGFLTFVGAFIIANYISRSKIHNFYLKYVIQRDELKELRNIRINHDLDAPHRQLLPLQGLRRYLGKLIIVITLMISTSAFYEVRTYFDWFTSYLTIFGFLAIGGYLSSYNFIPNLWRIEFPESQFQEYTPPIQNQPHTLPAYYQPTRYASNQNYHQAEVNSITCPSCGQKNETSYQFCVTCGFSFV